MKYADLEIDDNLLEFHKALTGRETLFLNGNSVSENKSVLGGKHLFNLNNKTYTIESDYRLFKVLLTLSENDIIVQKEETEIPGIHVFYLVFIPMSLIIIFLI